MWDFLKFIVHYFFQLLWKIPCSLHVPVAVNSMKESPYWVANSSLHNQETLSCLWGMKNHYLVYKTLLPVYILSQINTVQAISSYFLRSTLILSPHLCLPLPSCLFPTSLPIKTMYAFLFSIIHATCNCLHPPVIPPSQDQISFSAPYSYTPSAYILPSMWWINSTLIQNNRQDYTRTVVLYILIMFLEVAGNSQI
jgi:hypothetical protein